MIGRKNRGWFMIFLLSAALVLALGSGVSVGRDSAHPPEGMVLIPGGTYWMGCAPGDKQCEDDEFPRHKVKLSAFYMDVHEVTVAEYGECVSAGSCKEPDDSGGTYWGNDYYNWGKPDRQSHPVNGVEWKNANAYCRWKGKRLPTEAEFEYALRGGKEGTKYPWGDSDTPPPACGNYTDESTKRIYQDFHIFSGYDDGYIGTAPVCSFPKNAFGLCDISGNAWEWCSDYYHPEYYSRSPSRNPKGALHSVYRVVRGGGWNDTWWSVRASFRWGYGSMFYFDSVGFRCARDGD